MALGSDGIIAFALLALVSLTPSKVSAVQNFTRLACNANLESETCYSWSRTFGDGTVLDETVTIPCGRCFFMNGHSSLTLNGGLDIQGKLVFPDGFKIHITTPYVVVQGELHMTSSKPVDGQEDVKFTLTGTDNVKFRPARENVNHCDGVDCDFGAKPFVVAGGQLVISALPEDFPSWTKLYDVGSDLMDITVSDTVKGKWEAGAEVMITSHSHWYDDEQVRTIVEVSDGPPGFTKLTLDSAILRPTTLLEHEIYASEVALLSRNIVIEGVKETGSNELIGMHTMVFHTPKIVQKLEGVEFRNGGQQGIAGKYPIHFHFCYDVPESIVSKNLIRESNQRCAVVHATDYLTIQENIAYDTRGHCFMTEDGMERYNKFIKNLGALTNPVSKIIPNDGFNGRETDTDPATFWISNPDNDYIGNVAAGSQDSGFWFELLTSVRGRARDDYDMNPRRMKMGVFRDNVAHSNEVFGFRTYPHGYMPDEKAHFLNSYSFRHRRSGLLFHNSQKLVVDGGHFADNAIGLDLGRSEYIDINGTHIIGESPEYKSTRLEQGLPKVCSRNDVIIAIMMRSFARHDRNYGIMGDFRDVRIEGLDPVSTGCDKSVAVTLNEEVITKTADFFTTLNNVSIDSSSPRLNFCYPIPNGINDFYLVDRDSSLKPVSSSASGVSTVIMNEPNMKRMITNSEDLCVDDDARCVSYCRDTCLRTVTYFVDPTAGNYTLQVCKQDSPSTCVATAGDFYVANNPDEYEFSRRNHDHARFRVYAAHLPAGQYDAKFVDGNGNAAWPVIAREQYEVYMCEGTSGLVEGDVRMIEPEADEAQCANLIRNGDAQSSSTYPAGWRHHRGGVKVVPGKGIGGSNALGSIRLTSSRDAISQYLDTRCMAWAFENEKMYEIKVKAKITGRDGSSYFCDPSATRCPSVSIGYYDELNAFHEIRHVATINRLEPAINGFQLIQGYFVVTSEVAASNVVEIKINRDRSDIWMYVDDVSMTLSEGEPEIECVDGQNAIPNGDFESSVSMLWMNRDAESLTLVPGYGDSGSALLMKGGSAMNDINIECFKEGERYQFSAKFRLLDGAGNGVACNLFTGNLPCPEAALQFYDERGGRHYTIIKSLGPQTTGWNDIIGFVTLDEIRGNPQQLRIFFGDIPSGHSLVVDNVEMKKISRQCENVIPFGNMDFGAAHLWMSYGSGTVVGDYSPGRGGSGLAVYVTNRSAYWKGTWFRFKTYGDMDCIQTKGQEWELTVQVKLLTVGTNTGATCDTSSSKDCPRLDVFMRADDSSDNLPLSESSTYRPSTWSADEFNEIKISFTVPSEGFNSITEAGFIIRGGDIGANLAIDDVAMRPVGLSQIHAEYSQTDEYSQTSDEYSLASGEYSLTSEEYTSEESDEDEYLYYEYPHDEYV